ncbi:Transmembrane protein [Methylorubrum populi]
MDVTARDWDERVDRACRKLPERAQRAVQWLREPSRFALRLLASILLILGGIFSILPILGLWMLPLGLALLAQDVPALKVPMEKSARWIERQWRSWRGR